MSWSRRITQWSRETFGKANPEAALRRVSDEIREFEAETDPFRKAEEAADLVITLANAVKRSTGFELSDFVDMKMHINRGRTWLTYADGTGNRVVSAAGDDREAQIRLEWFGPADPDTPDSWGNP